MTYVELQVTTHFSFLRGASSPQNLFLTAAALQLPALGKGRAIAQMGEKGKCFLHWEDVAHHAEGLVGALVPGMTDHGDPAAMRWMADVFDDRGHVCLTHQRRPNDALRLYEIAAAARRFGLTSLATGDILYDVPAKRMLQDVVTAIRENCTLDELGYRRERSADRHLKRPAEMVRRFKAYPEAPHHL